MCGVNSFAIISFSTCAHEVSSVINQWANKKSYMLQNPFRRDVVCSLSLPADDICVCLDVLIVSQRVSLEFQR